MNIPSCKVHEYDYRICCEECQECWEAFQKTLVKTKLNSKSKTDFKHEKSNK
jgi:hypothetical protein